MRTPRAAHVLLDVKGPTDGAFEGAVYLQLQAVTKGFLRSHGFDEDSDIYRCAMHDCELSDGPRTSFMEEWDKRTNEKEPWDNLQHLVTQVNRTTPAQFRDFVQSSVDLDGYLKWMALQEVVATELHQDSLVDPEFIAPVDGGDSTPRSAWWLCQFVTERRNFLLGELARIESHGRTALKVDAVGRTAEGRFFVELRNTSDAPVDLGELYLTGDPRKPTQWRLPAVSLPPGGTWRFTQGGAGPEELGATLDASRPEVGLFSADGRTAVDVLFFPSLAPGAGYRRGPGGSEDFVPLP